MFAITRVDCRTNRRVDLVRTENALRYEEGEQKLLKETVRHFDFTNNEGDMYCLHIADYDNFRSLIA